MEFEQTVRSAGTAIGGVKALPLHTAPAALPRAAFFRQRHTLAGGRHQRPTNGARIPEIAGILRTQRAQLIAAARAQIEASRPTRSARIGAESTL